MPKSTSPHTHDEDALALQQMEAALPSLVGDSTYDQNASEFNVMFKVLPPNPADITEAALDAGTGFNIIVEAQIDGQRCKWFNGFMGMLMFETTAGNGEIDIDDVSNHVTFAEGRASVAVTPTGAWAVNDTFILIPAGNMAGDGPEAGVNYDLNLDTITVVE